MIISRSFDWCLRRSRSSKVVVGSSRNRVVYTLPESRQGCVGQRFANLVACQGNIRSEAKERGTFLGSFGQSHPKTLSIITG